MKDDREGRARDRLVVEARRESMPEVNWDAMEASLMSRLAEGPRLARASGRVGQRSFVALALAAVAAAGVAAAAVGVVRHVAPDGAVAVAPAAAEKAASSSTKGRVNGNALAVGAEVAAVEEAVTVEHEGHATWTLDSDSKAHIESIGPVVAVSLDRGALTASVVHSPRPESFVVRVEHTRIAVHGTAFRVVRLENSVRVEVSQGVVGVGPLAGPSFDVAAPSTATMTLDGARTDQRRAQRDVGRGEGHRHGEAAETAGTPPEQGGAEPTSPPAPEGHAATVPEVPARAPRASSPTPSIDGVVEAVRRCFREQTVASGDLHISVSTQMSLRVQPSGRIGEAVFTPPLAPGVRRCVDDTVGAVKFSSSTDGFAIDRVLELER